MKNKYFITIEGVDGAGKSTHVETIINAIKNANLEVVSTREPGGTIVGEKIREMILHDKSIDITAETETMLMFADRKQHIQEFIQPNIDKNICVVCDRFTDSTYAYQGGGKKVDKDFIKNLENVTHPNLQPGLTFLFDLPVEISMKRLERNRGNLDKLESNGIDFFREVRESYKERVKNDPQRFVVIDSSQTIDVIKEIVIKEINNYINNNLKKKLKM